MTSSKRVCQSNKNRTTVIIPTFNRAAMLRECLAAVAAQTLSPFEVIIVNDGSSDETRDVVLSAGGPLHLIDQPNSGKSAALNAALAVARGDYIWIVDDDDIVLPDALAILTALLDDTPGAGFAYGRHDRFADDVGTATLLGTGYWQNCMPDDFLQATLEDLFAHQPSILVRRSVFERVGAFDVSLARSQDYDMLLRLARYSIPAVTNKVVFLQRQHDGRRGPAAQRFDRSEAQAKWIESDQSIFRRIYDSWPLELFAPRRSVMTAGERRTALINRGVAMARRKLWTLALADFEAAADAIKTSLTDAERAALRRSVLGKYGCREVVIDRAVGRLLARFATARQNKPIARAMARGLLWRVRAPTQTDGVAMRLAYARLWLRMMI